MIGNKKKSSKEKEAYKVKRRQMFKVHLKGLKNLSCIVEHKTLNRFARVSKKKRLHYIIQQFNFFFRSVLSYS